MMITLTEPTDSLDPDLWAVYGDWLSDRGDDLGGERARCISRGLRKTGGTLWLQFRSTDDKWLQSSFHLDKKWRENPYKPDPQYEYRWVEENSRDYPKDLPNNPVMEPDPFLSFPQGARLYWDKLAELGGFIPPPSP